MKEVTIRALAHKGDSKGEINMLEILLNIWDILVSGQQEARHVESVAGKIILKKSVRQSHMLSGWEGTR